MNEVWSPNYRCWNKHGLKFSISKDKSILYCAIYLPKGHPAEDISLQEIGLAINLQPLMRNYDDETGQVWVGFTKNNDECRTSGIPDWTIDDTVTEAEALAKKLSSYAAEGKEQGEYGCGNHGCLFSPPLGQGTNAGCKCLDGISPKLRRAIEKKLGELRDLKAKFAEVSTKKPGRKKKP